MPNDPLGLRGDPLGLRDKPVSAAPPSPLPDLQPSRASILPGEIVRKARDRFRFRPNLEPIFVDTTPPPPRRPSEETVRSFLPRTERAIDYPDPFVGPQHPGYDTSQPPPPRPPIIGGVARFGEGAIQAVKDISRLDIQPEPYTEMLWGGTEAALAAAAPGIGGAFLKKPLLTAAEITAGGIGGYFAGQGLRAGAEAAGVGPGGQELLGSAGEIAVPSTMVGRTLARYGRPVVQTLSLKPPPSPVPRQPRLEPPPEIPRSPELLPEPSGATAPPSRAGDVAPEPVPSPVPELSTSDAASRWRAAMKRGAARPEPILWKYPPPPEPIAPTPKLAPEPGPLLYPAGWRGGKQTPADLPPSREILYPERFRRPEPPGSREVPEAPPPELPKQVPEAPAAVSAPTPEPAPTVVPGEPPRPLRTPLDPISSRAHRKIFALAKSDKGLVDSTIYGLTGKSSIRNLTRAEASRVIADLEGRPRMDLEPPPSETPPIEAYEGPSYERAPRGPKGPEIPPEEPPPTPPREGPPPLEPPTPRPPDPETRETIGLTRLALRRAFADNYQNIKKEGATGKDIQRRLEETQTATEVRSQGDHEDLIYPQGEKKNGLLKITEEEKINLKDSVEGRAEPLNPRVAVLRDNFNAIADRLADRAEELGVMVNDNGIWRPFKRRKGWVPHSFASPEELAKAGGIRKRIIQNMVDSRGFTKERAESFIKEWILFQTSKTKDHHPAQLITWLKDTRQAKSTAEALGLLERFKARDVPRSGSLEYPRKLDLPLDDPDPSRAMLRSITKEWERLSWIEQFGQELPSAVAKKVKGPIPANQLDEMLKMASAEGADTDMIHNRLSHILRTKNQESWIRTVSTRARLLNVSLLGQMAELNVFQGMLGTAIRGGPKAAAYGLGKMFTKSGREFSRRSGSMVRTEAAMALGEEMPTTGSLAWAADKFLKVTGGSGTEMANRWTASNGGHVFTRDMLRWMQADPETIIGGMKVKHAKRQLERLGLDPNREPTMEEFYKAANRFDRDVNFSSKEGHTPIIGSGPVGKMFWQFKNFIYNQSRLIFNEAIKPLGSPKEDPIGFLKASRNLIILSTLYPFVGDRVRWWRSKKKGQAYMDRFEMETAVERYLKGATATGALGMGGEFYEAGEAGRMESEILGPTFGGVAEVGERTIQGGPMAGAEAIARRAPMGQPIVSRLKEPGMRRRKRYKTRR